MFHTLTPFGPKIPLNSGGGLFIFLQSFVNRLRFFVLQRLPQYKFLVVPDMFVLVMVVAIDCDCLQHYFLHLDILQFISQYFCWSFWCCFGFLVATIQYSSSIGGLLTMIETFH